LIICKGGCFCTGIDDAGQLPQGIIDKLGFAGQWIGDKSQVVVLIIFIVKFSIQLIFCFGQVVPVIISEGGIAAMFVTPGVCDARYVAVAVISEPCRMAIGVGDGVSVAVAIVTKDGLMP
jgi:hypothetical protein